MPNRPIPGMPQNWQIFVVSSLFSVVLPMIPLGIEKTFQGEMTIKSLSISAAIYSISLGSGSPNVAMFGSTVLVSIVFSIVFGISMVNCEMPSGCSWTAFIAIVSVSAIHICERYNEHVVNGLPFFLFHNSDSGAE